MRLKATRLPLSEIADRWARESVRTPGELDLQAIRRDLFIALRNGDLTIADPQREQAARYVSYALTDEEDTRDWKHERRETPEPLQITPDLLRKAMVPRQGKTKDSHNIDDYDKVSVQVWFDEITVDKEGFGFWCDDHGHQRPEFWFGKSPDVSRGKQGKRGRDPWPTTPAIREMIPLLESEIGGSATPGRIRKHFRAEGITKDSPRTFHKGFKNAYLEWPDTLHWKDRGGHAHDIGLGSLATHRRALEKA